MGLIDQPSCYIYFTWLIAFTEALRRVYWLPWYLLEKGHPVRDFLGSNAILLQPVIAIAIFAHLFCLYAVDREESSPHWLWRPAGAIVSMWGASFVLAATLL